MARPPFGQEREVTVCDSCGDRLIIPPGVNYQGLKLHKHCAQLLRQQNKSNDVVEPFLDNVEQEIEEVFENMEAMETPNWPY